MAENLILYDLTSLGGAENLVLNDAVVTEYEESVEGIVFWRWEDEPASLPQFLGTASAGSSLDVPFTISGQRQIRLFLISRTADGDQTETDPRRSEQQLVYTPPAVGVESIVYHEGEIVFHGGEIVTHSV
ncbi:MAG TPA: hypothetical protein VIL74_20590 [Pyrinomonadaceae bacterium]|jgi:hypothetical protein